MVHEGFDRSRASRSALVPSTEFTGTLNKVLIVRDRRVPSGMRLFRYIFFLHKIFIYCILGTAIEYLPMADKSPSLYSLAHFSLKIINFANCELFYL